MGSPALLRHAEATVRKYLSGIPVNFLHKIGMGPQGLGALYFRVQHDGCLTSMARGFGL
jgi:hypothetical protein